jgi:ABC-type transport system substrate-binding protein
VLTELGGSYRNPEDLSRWSTLFQTKSVVGCFEHPEVNHLIKKGLYEKDPKKQKKLFYKTDELITSLQPGTFLFQKTAIDVMSKRFSLSHPFSLTHAGIHRLRHATLKHQ